MEEIKARLVHERSTKRQEVYQTPDDNPADSPIRTLYISKDKIGRPVPQRIMVTIEEELD